MKKLMHKGFTIIEVIIVLVIGAVIMLAVFLIVPQLQKAQRDSRRLNDARRMLTATIAYTTTNGTYPAASSIVLDQIGDLFANPNLFIDPDGVPYSVGKSTSTPGAIKTAATSTSVANASEANRMTLNYKTGCNGKDIAFDTNADKNKIAISVYQENSGYACISNNQ